MDGSGLGPNRQFQEDAYERLGRIDERTEIMLTKITEFCAFQREAAPQLYLLTEANLPKRLGRVEGVIKYAAGGIGAMMALVTFVLAAGYFHAPL